MRSLPVSVVIPVFNLRHSLEMTLYALEIQDFDRSAFECIIVDDGSTDGTADFLSSRQWNINLSVLHNHKTIGRSIARNQACEIAQGDVIAFLDGDMLPVPGWLAAYQKAFTQCGADVVSGARYCLKIDSLPCNLKTTLSQLIEVNDSELLRGDIQRQYSRLASQAQRGQYSSLFAAEFEQQLYTVCEQYPRSLARAYSFMASNGAVTKTTLMATGGFSPLLHVGEDFDLGIRMAEAGCRFMLAPDARTYRLDCSTERNGAWKSLDRLGFLYRNPYRSAVMASLYHSDVNSQKSSIPGLCSPYGLTGMAANEQRPLCSAWSLLLASTSADTIPGDFDYSEAALVKHFSEAAGIGEEIVREYLTAAVSNGLIVRQSATNTYFDIHHTSNWLRTRTRYQESWLRNASFGRNHPTPQQEGGRNAQPLHIHCKGRYALELTMTPEVEWKHVMFNMCIPIEHRCQKNVRLLRLTPPELEAYLSKEHGLIAKAPSELWRDDGIAVCEFECDISEEICRREMQSITARRVKQDKIWLEYLRFTFPASHLEKSRSLLNYILDGRRSDAMTDIRQIYCWIVENLSYTNTPLPDYTVLDTGAGSCVQLTRLFVNLVRLRGLPAREQCGALMTRSISPSEIKTISHGYSPFAHTWAEVYVESTGWYPVDFIVMGYGEWQTTIFNVGMELRAELAAQGPLLADYYFGCIDPYRIYAHHYANKLFPVTVASSAKNQRFRHKLLPHIRHHLTCSLA